MSITSAVDDRVVGASEHVFDESVMRKVAFASVFGTALEAYDLYRLAAFGVFADPNDLSMIVVLSMIICLGGLFLLGRFLAGLR